MQRSLPRQRAFTLVEVLVVLGILAILASFIIPVSSRISERARASTCMSNLRNLGVAVNLYIADNKSRIPELVSLKALVDDPEPSIDTALASYLGEGTDVFFCPADHKGIGKESGTSFLWNSLLNGQHIASVNLLGLFDNPSGIPLISDKEGFHPYPDQRVNILYVDGHTSVDLQFNVGP